jgi:hypothetical protein
MRYSLEAKPGFVQITARLAPSAGYLAPADRQGGGRLYVMCELKALSDSTCRIGG